MSAVDSIPSCCDCRYFQPDNGLRVDDLPNNHSEEGQCRRRAPVDGYALKDVWDRSPFPHVLCDDWCGEFEPCRRVSECKESVDNTGQSV